MRDERIGNVAFPILGLSKIRELFVEFIIFHEKSRSGSSSRQGAGAPVPTSEDFIFIS